MGQRQWSSGQHTDDGDLHAVTSNSASGVYNAPLDPVLDVSSLPFGGVQCLPRIFGFPPTEEGKRILSCSLSATIANALPSSCRHSSAEHLQWHLLYSSALHGRSFQKLVHRLVDNGPTVIVIKSLDSPRVFGGFCEEPWLTVAAREKRDRSRSAAVQRASREGQKMDHITIRPAGQNHAFFGSESCFLFTDAGGGTIYPPRPSVNSNFMYLFDSHPLNSKEGIGMGGQPGHFAWFLDNWLEKGACHGARCSTFNNTRLTDTEEWVVECVEAYAVHPEIVKKLRYAAEEKKSKECSYDGGTSCLLDCGNGVDELLLELHGAHQFGIHDRPEC